MPLAQLAVGNLPVNWPKLLGPFQNGFTNFFDVFTSVWNVILHHFWYKEVRYNCFGVLESNLMPSSRRN